MLKKTIINKIQKVVIMAILCLSCSYSMQSSEDREAVISSFNLGHIIQAIDTSERGSFVIIEENRDDIRGGQYRREL